MSVSFKTTVTDVTMSSAKLSCTVSGAGSMKVVSCGFQIHVDNGYGGSRMTKFLAEHGEYINCELEDSSFSYECTGCKQGILISARPYLKGEKEEFYGESFMVTIKTEQDYAPTVSDLKIDSITIDSANLSAVVLASDSSYPVLETGFKYRPKHGDVSKTIKCTPDAKGKITAKLEGLGPGVDYVVWAYASCSISGTFKFDSFSTHGYEVLPTVSTPVASDITRTGMSLSAVVTTQNNSYKATEAGFLYKTQGSYQSSKVSCVPSEKGEITTKLTSLTPGTCYEVWSYVAYDSVERKKKEVVSTSGDEILPTVSAPVASDITRTGMSLSAVVTTPNASYKATEAGFFYSQPGTVDVNKVTCTPLATGEMTAKISGLEPDTKYVILSYVVSESVERTNASEASTLGKEALPSVSVSDFGSVSESGFSITASVETNHASYTPSEVGFVFKRDIEGGPTTLDNGMATREVCTLSNGKFTLTKKDIGPGKYKVRAYLLSEGEDIYSKSVLQYSTDMSDCAPVVKLVEIEKGAVTTTDDKKRRMIVSVSALLEMTYGAGVTEKGFLYRMNAAPSSLTDGSSKLVAATDYSASVQLSIPDTGYSDWYFMAYATSKNGTGYSAPMRIRIWWKDYM